MAGETVFGSATTIMHKVLQENSPRAVELNAGAAPFDGGLEAQVLAKASPSGFQTCARGARRGGSARGRGREAPAATDATVVGTATMTALPAAQGANRHQDRVDPTQSTIRTLRQPAAPAPAAPAARPARSQGLAIAIVGGIAALGIAIAQPG